jgi:hypothetical protein
MKWRALLCWGAVITFLTMPVSIFLLVVISEETGWIHFDKYMGEFKWLGEFYRSITALVFGLSGLQSLDKYIAVKQNGKPKTDAH